MIEERKYFNLDVEEINDFNGCKLVLESHYGVNFHSADGKEIKMLIEYSDDYRHEDLVIFEDDKERYRIKFHHAIAISDFAKALYHVATEKDCDEINENAWRSSL